MFVNVAHSRNLLLWILLSTLNVFVPPTAGWIMLGLSNPELNGLAEGVLKVKGED
jgi:hypothetical protein